LNIIDKKPRNMTEMPMGLRDEAHT
jgi:hypothetical protein